MLTILLHSSKTMQRNKNGNSVYQKPLFLPQATKLANYLKTLSSKEIAKSMQLSAPMAEKTKQLLADWSNTPNKQLPSIDAFLGDIYSGLQVQTFTVADREFANNHLFILSGLYGVLRALDSISPYRLEMGYRLPNEPYRNLYSYWSDSVAAGLPPSRPIINLSAVEYTKAILPHIVDTIVITPKFMTVDQKTNEPKFVVVHAKIARGAFAHWLITQKVTNINNLHKFNNLGYRYDKDLSTDIEPVFVCHTFGGIGLSVRLTK